MEVLRKRKVELISEIKSFCKKDSISYARDKQITNKKRYNHIK